MSMCSYGSVFIDTDTHEFYLLVKVPTGTMDARFGLVCLSDGVFWDDPFDGFPTDKNLSEYLGGLRRFRYVSSELAVVCDEDDVICLPRHANP